ncbi:MAG: ASPIC/UnbV domain-containing protein [Planctomycetales bacterium]|nr:ASPIC/UnbV domain-containing protein [Planctomycetales bacterium]
MRSDENLPSEFRDVRQWTLDPFTGQTKPEYERFNTYGTEFHRHSYSGKERNKLFLNREGKAFVDISNISGADEIADSRGWIKWDYDHDGWQDIALVNANRPLLSLFHNRLATGQTGSTNRIIAVRLVGANNQSSPSNSVSNRDGYGAMVIAMTDDLKIRREHRCGEGYAVQNSSTMLIGIGSADSAELSVIWPSGATTGPITINAGQLAECFEDASQTPRGGFVLRDYR